jgi:hypothetical protein
MPFPLAGIAGGLLATRLGMSVAGGSGIASRFARMPLIQGGQFGVGYTSGAYLGYGGTNTVDPLRIHQSYKRANRGNHRLSYYGYGRRRYRRRYGRSRYSRYSGYRRYRRYRSRRYY